MNVLNMPVSFHPNQFGAFQFEVSLSAPLPDTDTDTGRRPKTYKVRLTNVAQINPEVLHSYLRGQQSHDNPVLTAITALVSDSSPFAL